MTSSESSNKTRRCNFQIVLRDRSKVVQRLRSTNGSPTHASGRRLKILIENIHTFPWWVGLRAHN